MHQRTISTLAELESVDWFANVGRNDASNAVILNTWAEAIESCEGEAWESLCLEAANQYRARLLERDPQRFQNWNVLVREIKLVSIPLVLRKTQNVVDANNLPRGFVDTVQWDILHLCMEAEFADVFPPGFFASQAYWYLKGHFPCGWQGDFPKGVLVVF
ncbi:hypothetical protein [Chromobacterium alticapitis]|uniref:Uncharacterized protein n=1 Tax=Chromobacterium alticapitis TaxID=2073169 RepID=A0A2S5DAI9_9NEIS|nr:hypothetical protein [Chromobacterium alticapitis]POZ59987.1 hypothetical protein C2I19_21295 [Chromobacterium alticapitis]